MAAVAVDTTNIVAPHQLAEEIYAPDLTFWSRSKEAPVHTIPVRVIRRPIACLYEEERVQVYMRELRAGDKVGPIDLLKVRAPLRSDPSKTRQTFYFVVHGCHRYEATRRLGLDAVQARVIEVSVDLIATYLGAGSPF